MLGNKIMLTALAFTLTALLVPSAVLPSEISPEASPAVKLNTPALEFTLNGVGGTPRSLSDFSGKYIVLEWTDFDCAKVQDLYDSGQMQKTQAWFRDHGVVWLSVVHRGAENDIKSDIRDLRTRLAKGKSLAADCMLDDAGRVAHLYRIEKVPTLCLIDPSGKFIWCGPIDVLPDSVKGDRSGATSLQAAFEASQAGKELPTAPEIIGCLTR